MTGSPVPPDLEGDIKGMYRNPEYAYEVSVPPGFIGKTSPPFAPQHGLRIPLAEKGDDSIRVYAAYDALFYRDVETACRKELDDIRQDDPHFVLIKKEASYWDAYRLSVYLHGTGRRALITRKCSRKFSVCASVKGLRRKYCMLHLWTSRRPPSLSIR
jgi:hypothetical protein